MDPRAIAEAFARKHELDFSLESLTQGYESVLSTRPPDRDRADNDFENGAACYLGETLARHFSGQWAGELQPEACWSFYTAFLQFGEYELRPFTYVGYRLANGVEDTGDVASFLEQLLPNLRDGVNRKRMAIGKLIDQGHCVLDSQPWV